ncbi:MAG: hypothetical protein ACJA2M_000301 [Polaribacter sp.]|jgi:hypothetical protein
MKVVRFENNKFGVRVGNWLSGYKFLSKNKIQFKAFTDVENYCQFKSIGEAVNLLDVRKINYTVLKKVNNFNAIVSKKNLKIFQTLD